MNQSTAIFLINDAVRAVVCKYDVKEHERQIVCKTFDKDIKVDDIVVVPTATRHGYTTVKVVEVDVDVDFDGTEQVGWIVQRIDPVFYQDVLAQEADALAKINHAEKQRKRKELAASLLANTEGLQNLSIAKIGLEPTEPTA